MLANPYLFIAVVLLLLAYAAELVNPYPARVALTLRFCALVVVIVLLVLWLV